MSSAFLAPLAAPCRKLQTKSTSRTTRRTRTPCAQMRRGFVPEPDVPDNLYAAEPIYDYEAKMFDFSTLTDKVVLVSNVASNDTYTEPNYTLFAKLLESYHDAGLEIVVFPSNWYGQKETKTPEEVRKFVHSTYSDKIIVMNKSDLEWNQVFALGRRYYPGHIIWNFHGKFLFNRQGLPVGRFDLLTTNEYIEDQVRTQINGGYNTPLTPDPDLAIEEDLVDA